MKNLIPTSLAGVCVCRETYFKHSQPISRVLPLFFVLLFLIHSGAAQTLSFNFSAPATSIYDYIAPGKGVEHWNVRDWDDIRGVKVPSGNTEGFNVYNRYNWSDFEDQIQGAYDWTELDRLINNAIDDGKMFSLGIMSMCTSCTDIGGLTYPQYLHEAMQKDALDKRDWMNAQGYWVPNWNSEIYLSRLEALLNAMAAHINESSRNGIRYKDVIYYVDVRGYGDFGEWHTWPFTGTEPPGRAATATTLKRIIDAYKVAFPDNPLIVPMGAFDTGNASQIPIEIAYYVLTTSNNWGQFGWRRDNLGDAGYNDWLEFNNDTYNNEQFSTLIMNKWKYAPLGGEPYNDLGSISDGSTKPALYDLPLQIQKFHLSFFGNGNYPVMNDDVKSNVIASSSLAGYRIAPAGGSINATLIPGNVFPVSMQWKNSGVAPTYENWDIYLELRDASTTVVWRDRSGFDLKRFLPQNTPTTFTDNFILPSSVPIGVYKLYLIVKDPLGYKKPLPLAIGGRNADGSYLLTDQIRVGTGSNNVLPVASAGRDTVIHFPTSTVQLSGSGSDADGSIANYNWSKVSGPSASVIQTPDLPSTRVTGLVPGTYAMKFTVSDNNGGAASDTVLIKVNQPPAVNAGRDTLVVLAGTSITLNGRISDNDGSIRDQKWSKLSGPEGCVIAAPGSSSSTVTGMGSGTYVFELSATDNDGGIARDSVQIKCNIPPRADAGRDTILYLPENTLVVDGGHSTDADGKIMGFTWRQVGGPAGSSISAPSAASTLISGLNTGTYTFELTVTDDNGTSDKDTIGISVYSNLRSDNYLRIYPNPAASYLMINLQSDSLINGNILIYDLQGIPVKKLAFANSMGFQRQVNIGELPAGTYLLEVIIANRYRMMRKFLKR